MKKQITLVITDDEFNILDEAFECLIGYRDSEKELEELDTITHKIVAAWNKAETIKEQEWRKNL